jgi:hypothetical protein
VEADVILYSYDLASISPGDAGKPVPPDKLKVFLWIAEGVDQPLEEWLAEQDSGPGQPVPPVVLSQTDVTLDARAGLKRVTESDGVRTVSYYVPTDEGNVFVVNAVPANSQLLPDFERILASIEL